MLIANPIYDVVFKYLLDDIEIARELLSTILGEDIVSLDVKPQETATEHVEKQVSIMRFDFKAVIKTPTGEVKKVLIELQKAKQVFDTMRFRRYLGDNYRKEDYVLSDIGIMEKRPLPIVTIYFLGFPLDNMTNAVIKINREYRDVITQEVIEERENFVELLTHDSYLIQIRQLKGSSKTKLERVLQVFSPEFLTDDPHLLDFYGDINDPLVKRMVDRLGRAIASEDVRNIMDVEDDIDRAFDRYAAIIEAKDKALEAKDKALETARQNAETARQNAETERYKAETERQKVEELQRQIEELKNQLKK